MITDPNNCKHSSSDKIGKSVGNWITLHECDDCGERFIQTSPETDGMSFRVMESDDKYNDLINKIHFDDSKI